MSQNTCLICGIVLGQFNEMCETCSAMIDNTAAVKPQTNFQPEPEPFAEQSVFPTASSPSNNSNWSNQSSSATENYQNNYQAREPTTNYHTRYSSAEPTFDKESPLQFFYDLSGAAKFFIFFVIFSIAFAFLLKVFMNLDVSVQSAPAANASNSNSAVNGQKHEELKPWFSSWFRAKPTGDEIFEKFEAATFAADKELISQTAFLSGKVQFLPPDFKEASGVLKLKKNESLEKTAPYENYFNYAESTSSAARPEHIAPWNFDSTFEMSIKTPDKMLMKMTMTPKNQNKQSPMYVYVTAGISGISGWNFARSVVSGTERVAESKLGEVFVPFNKATDGFAMTFLRKMYVKAELLNEEVVLERRVYLVKATPPIGDPELLYFDMETGLLLKSMDPKDTVYILDYRLFEGVQIPSKIVYRFKEREWILWEIQDMKQNVELDDSIFLRDSYKK